MPKTTVAALIATSTDESVQILLTRRAVEPFQDHWCLPGGHIEDYERAHDAIAREVLEETGLTFVPRFFAYFDEIIPSIGIHAVVLVFQGPADGQPAPAPGEVAEVGWFSLVAARSMPLAFRHNDIVNAYFEATQSAPIAL
jgi:8-oxo-dGTP diphosphatase